MGRRLILWDIDGTLVWWGPIGRGVFDDAIHEVVGLDPSGHGVSMGGKTDPQIALEILAALAVPEGEARTHLPGVLQALLVLGVAADPGQVAGRDPTGEVIRLHRPAEPHHRRQAALHLVGGQQC